METGDRHFQGGFAQTAAPNLWRGRIAAAVAFYPGFNIGVIAFMIGVALYFAWPTEPHWMGVVALFIVSGGMFWYFREKAVMGAGLILSLIHI